MNLKRLSHNKKRKKHLVFELILFSVGIMTISLFYKNNVLLTTSLLIANLIAVKFWYKKYDIYFFVIGAIVGPIGEIVCIHFGAWEYSNPTVLGIPIWLPLAWGLATVLIKRIVETILIKS